MHIIEPFDSGEKTQFVEAALFQLDPVTLQANYEADTLLLTHDVVELNERKVFLESVASYLGKDTYGGWYHCSNCGEEAKEDEYGILWFDN